MHVVKKKKLLPLKELKRYYNLHKPIMRSFDWSIAIG